MAKFLCGLRLGRKASKAAVSQNSDISPVPRPFLTTPIHQHSQAATTVTVPLIPSEKAAPAASSTSNATLSSQSTTPQLPRTEVAHLSPKDDFDFWGRAYEILLAREPDLTGDFAKHLATLQNDPNPLSPKSVQSIVTRLLDDREKKQWRVSLLGNDVVIREQAERLVKFLIWSDSIVSAAVSSQPYAALAWSGVSLLLPLLSSGVAANASMLKGFNSLCDLQIYWQIVEKTYLQPSRRQEYKELLEPIAKLYSHILEYQARVICHLSKAQLSRAWENVAGANDWDGKVAEIESLSERYNGYISPLEAEEVRKSRDMELQKMQESQIILDEIRVILEESRRETQKISEDQKQTALLQDLASDYESYKDFNPPRVQGTCEWFLTDERFLEWRSSDSGLLWVSAGPGCGKSVLSRALIDERRVTTNVATSTICYFFFKDGIQDRMYATDALSAILHQIFTNVPTSGLIQHALPSHKNYGKNLKNNFPELWRILMNCVKSPDAGEIVCVLDALDECHHDSRQLLINKLREYYQKRSQASGPRPRLKFLITSRPYDDLQASFNRFSNIMTFVRFDGDDKSAQISKEINLVIDARVDEIAHDFSEDSRRKIAEQLKSMEHRTYLWLHLTFDIIEQSPSEYRRVSDLEALLTGLPSQVSEAYERILEKSKNDLHTETLLQIVLAAVRPLTLDEANAALTIALKNGRFDSHAALESSMWPRENFKNTVKNLCGLFISVHESKLSFIHQTAREFLISPERKGKWQGRLDLAKSHSKMLKICLEYMPYFNEQIPISEMRVRFPLADYVLGLTFFHVEIGKTENDLQESVLDFFLNRNKAYKVWDRFNFEHDDPSAENKQLPAPLYYASYVGLERTVERLIKEGVDVNPEGGWFGFPLQAASLHGQKRIVQLLLNGGADVNAKGGEYGNALQAACDTGDEEIVQLLLQAGADINAQGGKYGNALQAASLQGNKEIVKLLLERGADVNAQGGKYGNALQAACLGGNKGVVQLLLEHGADVNAQGGYCGNALQAASFESHEIVEMLLERGADVNAQGGYYGTALQAACTGNKNKEIVQLLLESGANVNVQGGHYGNALQASCIGGSKEIVQLLLERGADVNAQGGHHGSALQAAIYTGEEEIIQLLLDHGAHRVEPVIA